MSLPTLTTHRLILRPFALSDAPVVRQLAGAREIAMMTLSIPHPYTDELAEQWICTHQDDFDNRKALNLAIVIREGDVLCGAIGLILRPEHARAELVYWVGVPYWGRGYGTEAARAIVRYGFESLELNRIYAAHFMRNPASGRVMQKIGMTYEGRLRQHVRKWDAFEDLACYGMLRSDWERR